MRIVLTLFLFLSGPYLAANAAGQAAVQAPPIPKGIIKLDGRLAPALKLKDLDGETFELAAARGKWQFVHFWASWCGPCRREMPTVESMAKQLAGSGLNVVLINTAEDEDTVFSFLATVAPDMPSLLDTDGSVTERWEPRGLPSTFLVDPHGRLRYLALGGRPWDEPAYLEFLRQTAAPR